MSGRGFRQCELRLTPGHFSIAKRGRVWRSTCCFLYRGYNVQKMQLFVCSNVFKKSNVLKKQTFGILTPGITSGTNSESTLLQLHRILCIGLPSWWLFAIPKKYAHQTTNHLKHWGKNVKNHEYNHLLQPPTSFVSKDHHSPATNKDFDQSRRHFCDSVCCFVDCQR